MDTITIASVVIAFSILSAFGIDVLLEFYQASAEPPPTQGCRNSIAVNASEGRCYHGVR